MAELYTEIQSDDDGEPGIHRADFANAVSTWSWMQQRPTSVAEAAMTFNTTPEIIRQAVEDHYWMAAGWPDTEADPAKQIIEHEGE